MESKQNRRNLLLASAYVIIVVSLFALLLSEGRFVKLSPIYRRNKELLASTAQQLARMLSEVEKGEAWHNWYDPYITVWLRDGQIASVQTGQHTQEPEVWPALTEAAASLSRAGIYCIRAYDFTYDSRDRNPVSSCEVWFATSKGQIIYSVNDALTYPYDMSNPDWGGYQFYQKRVRENWFLLVSRYDRDNIYWRT